MMRAVETLRQRLPATVGGTLGYAPVQLSDSEDGDGAGVEFGSGGGSFGRDVGGAGLQSRDGRRPRRRPGSGGAERDTGAGGGREEDDDMLWPPYTPLYTNMKVLRRKRLDASMMYPRAGPCECQVTIAQRRQKKRVESVVAGAGATATATAAVVAFRVRVLACPDCFAVPSSSSASISRPFQDINHT